MALANHEPEILEGGKTTGRLKNDSSQKKKKTIFGENIK